MKFTTLFVTLSILLIALPVLGQPDLTGPWCVSMSVAYSEGNDTTLIFFIDEQYEIVIDAQNDTSPYGIPFYGHVDVGGGEITYFSGVLDDNTISMTHWDSVTRGILKEKGNNPLQMNFINNAFDADNRSGKTSVGIAVKGACEVPET